MPPDTTRWPDDGTAAVVPSVDADGEPVFAVLAKRTYDLPPGKAPAPAAITRPLLQVDVYHDDGDPEVNTVRLENETAPFKIRTDVVVVGSAWAPGARPVPQLDATVEVGTTRKTVRVIGDRHCEYLPGASPRFTDPAPFVEMPLRYERAYGGTDERSVTGLTFLYPRNPRGTGVVLANTAETVNCLRLPNLEDPADPLTPDRVVLGEPEQWPGQPLPQGLGWFPKIAYPRCSFVGAMPAFVAPGVPLKEEELGLVPKNQVALARQFRLPSYDVRFNSGASIGLAVPFLSGGEAVRLTNLFPTGPVAFTLPRERPRIALDFGRGLAEPDPVLHTVQIRADEGQLDLVWRGAVRHPGIDWLPEMKRLVAEVVWP
jgi:hypothetical protein